MKLRTQCQYRLQHALVTDLSDLMMRRRSQAHLPMGKLSNLYASIAYPWRLYDMLIDLAKENVPILVGVGDNLHDRLVGAREYTLDQTHSLSTQTKKIQPVPHIPLRAPTWLHLRVLLAGMVELNGVRVGWPSRPSDPNWRESRPLIARCQTEIGFSLTQLAEGCDQCGHWVQSELLHSLGSHYLQLGTADHD